MAHNSQALEGASQKECTNFPCHPLQTTELEYTENGKPTFQGTAPCAPQDLNRTTAIPACISNQVQNKTRGHPHGVKGKSEGQTVYINVTVHIHFNMCFT